MSRGRDARSAGSPRGGRTALALALLAVVCLTVVPSTPSAAGPGAAAFAKLQQAFAAGDLDTAIREADVVLKAEPDNVAYLNLIGAVYCAKALKANVLTRLSWGGRCRDTWEHALTVDPAHIDIRFNLINYYAEAPGLAGGGMDKAKAQARRIAELDAVRGELAWASVARHENQLPEAEHRYRRAAAIDPGGMRGPVALASFLVSQKRWADARAVFEPRLTTNPNDTFAAFQIGALLLAEGADVAKALPYFDRFLAAPAPPGGPAHADAWVRKGQALDRLGRRAEAIAAFEAALATAPGHPGAQRELKRIKG